VEVFIALVLGIGLGIAGLRWWHGRMAPAAAPKPAVFSCIEEMRAVGELSVFKLVTKEIVTTREHSFGEFGQKYLEWMVSSRKMAMVLSFEIDFRYDLRSAEFSIRETAQGVFELQMPNCHYDTRILDVRFYDEQSSKFLPWLLPDLLNRVFGPSFSEADKNRLIDEAKREAAAKAESLVRRMRSDVQKSARTTVTAIAHGFNAESVEVRFREADAVASRVEYRPAESESVAA
jgi:hypothetical protein